MWKFNLYFPKQIDKEMHLFLQKNNLLTIFMFSVDFGIRNDNIQYKA